nr:hypothetical protein [Candidatus Sigynarchaeota archaeon]
DEKEMELVYLMMTGGGINIQDVFIKYTLSDLQESSDDSNATRGQTQGGSRGKDETSQSRITIGPTYREASPVSQTELSNTDATRNISEIRHVFDLKIEKLRNIAKDYVENLLAEKNEIELKVLRHLLNELLPLKEIHLDPGIVIKDAIHEKNLPWQLDGEVYKRTGPYVDLHHHEQGVQVERAVKSFCTLLHDCLKDNACISFDDFQQELQGKTFSFPDGENIETMIDRSIREGLFSGYVDLVDQRIYRPKSDDEKYQQAFHKELDVLAKEIKRDVNKMLELERIKGDIPRDLEAVLIAPEKPKDLAGLLDKTQAISKDLQQFLLDAIKPGMPASVDGLVAQIKTYGTARNVTFPFSIDRDAVEKLLEEMVLHGLIDGHFKGDNSFLREK